MPAFVYVLPVLPGKEEDDRKTLEELTGPRRDEYEAALRDAGVTRHVVWHQLGPEGMTAVVYMEADEEAAVVRFGAAEAPFNTWFREAMKDVHGVDIGQGAPSGDKVLDVQL